MRTILGLLSMLALFGFALAADPTTTAAPAPTVAPAPAAPVITWSGMAMVRLREEIVTNERSTGVTEKTGTFSYQLGYRFGAKVKPNEQVLLQFDIGNDWNATDVATGIPGNYTVKRDPVTPYFNLAYAQWDPGCCHLAAGIIPVKGSALMDLLGVSIYSNRSYQKAAHLPWSVLTQLSQTGLRVGMPVLKGDVTMGLEIMSAIIQQRSALIVPDTFVVNGSAVEFLVEAPLAFAATTVTPQVFVIPNRSYNMVTRQGDMELGAGVDLSQKFNSGIAVRGGFGYAQNSNQNAYGPNDTITYLDPSGVGTIKTRDTLLIDRSGITLTIGTTVKVGPGKFDCDLSYSTETDAGNSAIDDAYEYVDLKYGWAVNKNFIIMPRCRFFMVQPKTTYNSKLTTRPELILTGTF